MFFKECDLYDECNEEREQEKPTFNFWLAYALFSSLHK